ncbi:hypothetical protein [Streptomyces sp. SP17KL33]|uniref:hypothetical protein n=1 Tax=Streptomyces sp. SP17KL33 TaxID=3002534 RepID=UPI003FCEDE3D
MTVVVWARLVTMGQPKPSVAPFRSGVRMRGTVIVFIRVALVSVFGGPTVC